jgi:hypothetical protein
MIRLILSAGSAALIAVAVCVASVSAQQRLVQEDLIDQVPVARKARALEQVEPPNLKTMRLLRSKAEFKVEIMSLADFAKFLTKRYKVPFRIDPAGLERARVEPSAPVSAEIAEMPLSAALKQILGRLNLDYRVVNGAVLITDPQPAVRLRRRPGRVVLHNGEAVIIQGAVPGANAGPALKQQALRQLGPLMQVEVLFAKRTCKPTREQMQKMKGDLQKLVQDDVNDFFDLMQGRVARAGGRFQVARKMLDDRLAGFIEANLSKERAGVYRDEVEKRNANEREVCVLNLVALLDRELGLSSKQREAIRQSLSENWDDSWSQAIEVGAMRGQNYVPSIPDDLVETHLAPSQCAVWQNMQKIGNVNWGFQVFRLGWFGTPVGEPDNE